MNVTEVYFQTDEGSEASIWLKDGLVCFNTGAGSLETVRITRDQFRKSLSDLGLIEKGE